MDPVVVSWYQEALKSKLMPSTSFDATINSFLNQSEVDSRLSVCESNRFICTRNPSHVSPDLGREELLVQTQAVDIVIAGGRMVVVNEGHVNVRASPAKSCFRTAAAAGPLVVFSPERFASLTSP
ncbi:hypothetical protein SeMB42_g02392 [Synchytrium endobioticum]|uniref:Uncharacterized protein n=1 Tax=Synchytrium endobioticum TaxID=286115 RepID=A0A507DEM7_9FUNG|nr:hypothetical protein SeMB42_g02392 [Synchytrium endobioticum]